jgi:hypothetical protein
MTSFPNFSQCLCQVQLRFSLLLFNSQRSALTSHASNCLPTDPRGLIVKQVVQTQNQPKNLFSKVSQPSYTELLELLQFLKVSPFPRKKMMF